MPTLQESPLFQNIPEKDYFSISQRGHTDYNKVVKLLRFKTEDVATATGVPVASVRYDERIPQEVSERISEWGTLMNLVAQFFKGNEEKTLLWFSISNPMLGGVIPRDMIRLGRGKKLIKIVVNALTGNTP
jgi:uncharacterized protein (DUF2384 family)